MTYQAWSARHFWPASPRIDTHEVLSAVSERGRAAEKHDNASAVRGCPERADWNGTVMLKLPSPVTATLSSSTFASDGVTGAGECRRAKGYVGVRHLSQLRLRVGRACCVSGKVIQFGTRYKMITASIVQALSAETIRHGCLKLVARG